MIKEAVNSLIKKYGTNNPFELCDLLNIKIMYSNLGPEIKGFFQRTPNGFEIVHINSCLEEMEKKYICAHELGHAILHVDLSIVFF
ncbi:TPA: ImmA/IrrE family metallo-endopeptidase, partial [Escherichia coli]